MIKINKESDTYDFVANCIATAIGFAGSALVGSFSNSIIAANTQNSSSAKKLYLKAGKFGLETLTTYTVAKKMREEIDEVVDIINDVSEIASEYLAQKNEEYQENSIEIVKQ